MRHCYECGEVLAGRRPLLRDGGGWIACANCGELVGDGQHGEENETIDFATAIARRVLYGLGHSNTQDRSAAGWVL